MINTLFIFKAFWEKNARKMIFLVGLLFVCLILFGFWHRAYQAEEQTRQVVALSNERFRQCQELSQELHISEANAKELQAAYDELKSRPPVASFTVQAPSLEVATEQVAERIDKQDVTLPPVALEETDRTVIVSNTEEIKVDVLKINLDKPWEVSAGIGSHQGDVYLPVGVQKNYAKHKAVAVEAHLKPDAFARGKAKTSGWEIKHVWRY